MNPNDCPMIDRRILRKNMWLRQDQETNVEKVCDHEGGLHY
jgi:hypothetical protein